MNSGVSSSFSDVFGQNLCTGALHASIINFILTLLVVETYLQYRGIILSVTIAIVCLSLFIADL
jgi:hypothetical protein